MGITAAFAEKLLGELYHLRPRAVAELPQPPLDWRGIFRVEADDGSAWVLRLIQQARAAGGPRATAELLAWLATCSYPAPRVCPTVTGELVGAYAGWWAQLISFVAGSVVSTAPAELAELGASLGRLHRLPAPAGLRWSRASPAEVAAETLPRYARGRGRAPARYAMMVAQLAADAEAIAGLKAEPAIVHGDCWPPNAVRGRGGGVTLIDWDAAGRGLAALDLGYLLLAAHFDQARPLAIAAQAPTVSAIMGGYQAARALSPAERGLLPLGVRFVLTIQVAAHLCGHERLGADDPVLAKLQTRFAATPGIIELAEGC